MAQQRKYFKRKVHEHKVDTIKPQTKEVKIFNTDPNILQDTDVKTLILNTVTAAVAFKTALKNLKANDFESNEQEKKEIIKILADMQNIIKLKILALKKDQRNEVKGESPKARNTQGSIHSPSKDNQSLSSRSNSAAFNDSHLLSLSTQSLCSTKSSLNDYLDDGDDVDDDDDYEDDGNNDDDYKKFKEFLVHVNCPFCLKHENNKNSLAKHLDTACTTFKNKIFVKSSDCPYSIFQILPNNAFRCNICPNTDQSKTSKTLKRYFTHSQSATHVSNYEKAASSKPFTELIFCAACKIQIPNNATQIKFHLAHEVHQRNRKDQRSTSYYRHRGIQCIYSKEKRFKCLHCPPGKAIYKSIKEILLHLQSEAHVKHFLPKRSQLQETSSLYCMFCLEEINIFNVIGHFNSIGHALKEEEENNSKFELCFYCGFQCSNLQELGLHTEGCLALDAIRRKNYHQEGDKFDKVSTQTEEDQKRPTDKKTSEKGRCIIVKDYPKILELYNYFKRLDEILEIEPSGENAVMIKFKDEKTVDEILESSIVINGVNLNITRKEDLESSRTSRPVPVNDGSASPGLVGHGVIGDSAVRRDFAMMDGVTLEGLFNRVSSHLSHTVLKPDCEDFLNIAHDCEQILKSGKCHSVGFLKCGLSFPVEKITLYYEFSKSLIEEASSDGNITSVTESILFNENMCKVCINLFQNSESVSDVSLREKGIPLVEFYHRKTRKLCTITFRQSDNIVADSLRSGAVNTSSHNLRKRPGHNLLESIVRSRGFAINNDNVGERAKKFENNSVMEMFKNFLLFLDEFDFENQAICLPLEYGVPKTELLEGSSKRYLCKWYNTKSPVWILDPFLFNNMAEDVEKSDWDSLLETVRETIDHYHLS